MIEIRGRAYLENYSRVMPVVRAMDVNEIFDELNMPSDLRPVVLAIKNGRVIQHSDVVEDGDVLDLLILPEGG
ncbi:MAG TPA: hypothetical protein PLT03_05405 [Bacillota bacterium]|nr:hypothetical protein [Bacillota bacterium]HOG53289.1 hypothetical protein [Bacillota bacterium]